MKMESTVLTIEERLTDLRKERKLTLEALAEATHISRAALGKYESGDFKDISPFSIVTLAKFYGVTTDYLMGVSNIENRPDAEIHYNFVGQLDMSVETTRMRRRPKEEPMGQNVSYQ